MKRTFATETLRAVIFVLLTVVTAPHFPAAQEKPTRWTPEVMMRF